MVNAKMSTIVREATPADREFTLQVVDRLAAFGPPSWRAAEEIVTAEARTLEQFYAAPRDGTALLIAEHGDRRAGFAYLETVVDYFTGESHGHLGIIAVDAASEGRGVGHALVTAAEAWARSRGYRRLTLNVFENNVRARRLYERLGYAPETLRYVRLLD
jgi:ribosomal protein S18 acetylase RimI-like enzyme